MPMPQELLTPTETSIVSGVPIREVYKVARERLPAGLVVRKSGKMFFKPTAAVCFRIDHELPKDVPVAVRKAFYVKVGRNPRAEVVEHEAGPLRYVLDASAVTKAVAAKLAAYRGAMDVIVEDRDVQGGAPTFKGTRILVRTIADLLQAGASGKELKEDYPRLSDDMIAAASVYARAHPKRGRRKARPPGRSGALASTRRYRRTAV